MSTNKHLEFIPKSPEELSKPEHVCTCKKPPIPDDLLFTPDELLLMFNIIMEGNVKVKQIHSVSLILNKIDTQFKLLQENNND